VISESAEELSSPRISPRGDRIAFFSLAPGSASLEVVDASGKGRKTLSKGWPDIYGVPCWSADGS